jgi:hypothetical protein
MDPQYFELRSHDFQSLPLEKINLRLLCHSKYQILTVRNQEGQLEAGLQVHEIQPSIAACKTN